MRWWAPGLLACLVLTWPAAGRAGQATTAGERGEILVAAAADLAFVFREIIPAFERGQGTRVTLTLGSSGQLAQQIEHGAPYDVFFSASADYIEGLRERGKVRADSITTYAQGRLVLATRGDRTPPAALAELGRGAVLRVALANPAHAPYGRAAKEALERTGLWERLRPKLVFGENVAQVQQFLRTGNVDVALLPLSMVQTSDVRFIPIESNWHRPITQVAAVTTHSGQPGLARAFIRFVGDEGRSAMKRFGFLLPGEF